ncbi:MAG TPA: YIP1 family protein [Acidobacteriaceae bacterium]|nr:YIP1 family protein [Acidobacteriaceae bacterium]
MPDTVAASEVQPLSQVTRVVDTFVAPSRTFMDIRRSASWWLPFVLICILSFGFAYTVLHKVGLPTLVDSIIHTNASLSDRIASAPPDQAAKIRSSIEMQFRFMYIAPVIILIVALIIAGIFLGTANFVFGGKANYKQMLAVWFFGTLPMIFISLLTIVTLFAGMQSDNFNIKNTIGTNIGYFLQGGDSPHWLVTMLSSVDVFAIWSAILLTLGISIVAGIKRSSAAIVVFGWWAIYVLGQTAIAAITG